MKAKYTLIIVLLVALYPLSNSLAGQKLMLSVLRIELQPGERIVGFQIATTGAGIIGMPRIPIGWTVSIDNDASWATTITGSIQVGTAALNRQELRDLLVIEAAPWPAQPLTLTGEIAVTDFKGAEEVRHIPLTRREFRLVKTPP